MFYRKDMLSEIEIYEYPDTWQDLIDMLPEHTLDSFHLCHVSQRSGSTVCIDEIHLLRSYPCILERQSHHALRTLALRIGSSHVVRIGSHTLTDDLGVDLRTARFGMLVLLQDQTCSSFA